MDIIAHIINKLKVRFRKLGQFELALMSMLTEAEIRQAECIADHPLAMPDVIGMRGCITQSSDEMQIRVMFTSPSSVRSFT